MNTSIKMDRELSPKLLQTYAGLTAYFQSELHRGICIAYSGGVDSTLLLKAASDAASSGIAPKPRPVLAVILETQLHPHSDTQQAVQRARQLHALPEVIRVNEFQDPQLLNNPDNRCYLCKHLLFSELKTRALEHGYCMICDGSNKDDEGEYRPGMKVLKELGIRSPLLELGITKSEVRALSGALGLPTAALPSTPCLATRLPYGTYLDRDLLLRIHTGEQWLREQGFYNVRLRFHEPLLRIEIDCSDFSKLLRMREQVIRQMKSLGFLYVTLDLEGFRSGSMDLQIANTSSAHPAIS